MVELDSAGGDLGSRWQVHDEPGLVGLVTDVRHNPIGDGAEFVQRLPVGVDLVVASPADAAAATIAEFASRGPAVLRELAATPVFADLGRLDPQSPLLSYVDKADEFVQAAQLPEPFELRIELQPQRSFVPVVEVAGHQLGEAGGRGQRGHGLGGGGHCGLDQLDLRVASATSDSARCALCRAWSTRLVAPSRWRPTLGDDVRELDDPLFGD